MQNKKLLFTSCLGSSEDGKLVAANPNNRERRGEGNSGDHLHSKHDKSPMYQVFT